ncbi:GPW/gp25 family protein [Acidaminococcus fermentans]|uniref:GPW/gp25 family protein n=1 Tax=Acidaminococcus fermentans TaxID=905 RepID=A0A6N7W1K0_ACIFE|nr:GPW/gp25 family protein [Acidaminococcus fermentans]MSS82373.1 GPW/gp25 family protein [Acidaminococcus fermentans]
MASEVFVLNPLTRDIDFAPKTVRAEILQNVRTIISTVMYSVPLDRAFGIDASFLDRPMAVAQAAISSEILRAVRRYEPRATITTISFTGDEDGKMVPKVEVSINES